MKKKQLSSDTIAQEISGIVQIFGELFDEIHGAFQTHRVTLKYQQTSTALSRGLRQNLVSFYNKASDLTGAEALAIQATAINFSKIFYDILRLSGLVETKVKEKVLFSDLAASELTQLMRRGRELLPHLADALQTQNPIIISHVEKEVNELSAIIVNSTNLHEDRLCKGICHPKASVIFMQMLDQFQDILWHYKALISKQSGMPDL
jgi:Na+/phosphate symporter